jgi:hypothetical protein
MKWGDHAEFVGGIRNIYKIFVRKREVNSFLGRTRCRCEDNIKIGLNKLVGRVWTGLIWILLTL